MDSLVLFAETAAITIAWNQPLEANGIQQYEIWYSETDGDSTPVVNNVTKDPQDTVFEKRELSSVLDKLKPNTTYSISIRAHNNLPGTVTTEMRTTLSIRKLALLIFM